MKPVNNQFWESVSYQSWPHLQTNQTFYSEIAACTPRTKMINYYNLAMIHYSTIHYNMIHTQDQSLYIIYISDNINILPLLQEFTYYLPLFFL